MSFIEVERSVRPGSWTMQGLHAHPHYEIYYLYQGSRQLLLRHSLCLSQACDGFSDGAIVNHFSFLRFALEWMANPFTTISIALSNSDCKQLKVEFIESRLNSAVLLALFFVECQKSLDKSSQKD